MSISRLLWRFLPLSARRNAGEALLHIRTRRAFDLRKLRPKKSYRGNRVVVAGLFRTATGLGKAAELVAKTIESTGTRVDRVDLTAAMGISITSESGDYLAPFECTNDVTDLVIVANPGHHNAVAAFDQEWLRERCVVGHWIWELEKAPTFWGGFLKSYDEIWAPTEYVRDSLFQSLPLTTPPTVVPYSISDLLVPAVEKSRGIAQRKRLSIAEDAFVIGYSFAAGSNYFRKNPEALIDAFTSAFSRNDRSVYLLLRCRDLAQHPGIRRRLLHIAGRDQRIIIVDDPTEMPISDFYAAIDLYASPSRCEGYGLNLVEAAQWNIPVITSGWHLPEEIKALKAIILIPYRLVPVDDPQGHYSKIKNAHWPEPDLKEFSRQILRIRNQSIEKN